MSLMKKPGTRPGFCLTTLTTLTTFLTTYLFYLIDFYLRALVKNLILLDISYFVMFNLL
ncbi:hypothetical protein SAMN04489735_10642 [Aneurinibacillus thermoaerophilus]|uniref:Uncharacterized protein n=1 Tax=Aneurinibacillus thermoaerophilus TaxID=143495 RepID=A0A1G8FEF3_ANETH|nr:hypothetical protein SAMN04489735_10642 [Aneurinibacillus thermoaerophilus]